MNQLQMKLPEATHRDDPASSHWAEAEHEKQRRRNIDRVLRCVQKRPGSTAEQLAQCFLVGVVEVRRRLSDLKRMGKARRGDLVDCPIAHRKVSSWWPV